MAQQGTSGKPPERRYDETVDPRNPPRAVINPRARSKALYVYLGGVILLFLVVALAFLSWPGVDRDVARIDTIEPQPVPTTGERLPGGGQPGGTPGSTAGELERRGAGESIRGQMPPLESRVVTQVRDLAGMPPADIAGRRVELQDVEVDGREGDTLWLRDGDDRVPVIVSGDVAAAPGARVDVGGVAEQAANGSVVVRATRIDVRDRD